ncbi:hypothetical protein HGM15179_001021 [Zosterops borbonicus]|uniref:Protein cornichon homolog 4 n=4 Tax=Sylvioidea TaxID=2116661 RepID=A0A8K1GYL6_9PASS|nr:hypothetical protein HGM15179_001021 [Zosterops borbonicus]
MESVIFIFSLIDCCALIFLSVYFIITLSDLECDYINARSCCSKLNKWVVPELIGHAVVTVLMLISLHWFIFLLNLPVATWNIYRYIMVPSGNMGVFDPTEIHNRGQLKSHMKEAMIKLGFHLLCFFMYLYRATSYVKSTKLFVKCDTESAFDIVHWFILSIDRYTAQRARLESMNQAAKISS